MYQVVESFIGIAGEIRKRVMLPDELGTIMLKFKTEPTQDEIDAIIDAYLASLPKE